MTIKLGKKGAKGGSDVTLEPWWNALSFPYGIGHGSFPLPYSAVKSLFQIAEAITGSIL